MPLFDFHCPDCAATVELLARASDTPTCPKCGGTALERLVSRPSAPGKSKEIIASARRQAAKEGHFSNY